MSSHRLLVEFDYESELVHIPEGVAPDRFEATAQSIEDAYRNTEKVLIACVPSSQVLWQCGSVLVRLATAAHILKWGGGKEIYVLMPVDAFLS